MTYRKLLPFEAGVLARHLLRLTASDRALRFMGALSDEAVGTHARRMDWRRTVVIGFFDAGILRGAAEIHAADLRPPIVFEGAFTVETAWQDQGVGTELLRRALLISRNRVAGALRISCFSDNLRIQHIGHKFGAAFRSACGEAEADIALPPPNWWSLTGEAVDDGVGLALSWCDRLGAVLRPTLARIAPLRPGPLADPRVLAD